jgi:uncharacterized protein YgiM (DUF1202 family)
MKKRKVMVLILVLVCTLFTELPVLAAATEPAVKSEAQTGVVGRIVINDDASVMYFGLGMITGSGVRVRQYANDSSMILGLLYNNELVIVNSKQGNWYNITTQGSPRITGYVHQDYIAIA